MLNHLKSDEIIHKAGGRFKLTALVQRRWQHLMEGARPLIEREGRTDLELAVEEIAQGKIAINYEESGITTPDKALR